MIFKPIISKPKQELIKLDTHSHTSGISLCSNVPPNILARSYHAHGVKMVVLTNHYTQRLAYRFNNLDQMATAFCEEFLKAKIAGNQFGIRVLFGAEVAIFTKDGYSEFLLFGLTPNFLLAHPDLYNMTQKQLYKLCHDNKILVYQAHPFREEHCQKPQDPEYLDGIEINRHPKFDDSLEKVLDYADRFNKGLSCGSDLHCIMQAGSDGIFVPDTITNEKQLANYLRKNKIPKMYMDYRIKVQL